MADNTIVDPNRAYIMSRVRQKDTRIEVSLRSILHRSGFRFRKNDSSLPGSPDIVLLRHNVVIFVHGCFWHGHDSCRKGGRPKSRTDYWLPKIRDNRQRDLRKVDELIAMGWRVAIVWQCSLDCREKTERTTQGLKDWITQNDPCSKVVEF